MQFFDWGARAPVKNAMFCEFTYFFLQQNILAYFHVFLLHTYDYQ